jgi:hypothetical protein
MNNIINEIEKVTAEAQKNFGGLSAAQLNWKPAPESWSVGQCLEHLIKTNTAMFSALDAVANGSHANSFWENYSPFTGFLGGYLAKSMMNYDKKFKAPSKEIIPPSEIAADVVSQFAKHNEVVAAKIDAVKNADMQKTVLTSPFMSLMTYKLSDALTIIVEHEKRHVQQAMRVMAMEGFPN